MGITVGLRRFWWPRGLRRESTAARLIGLRVRIPPGVRMSVCCVNCVLSGIGMGDNPITRAEESYRVCVSLTNLTEEAQTH